MLPKDPVILLSYINTQLRDFHESLDDLCKSRDIHPNTIIETLSTIDYHYDPKENRFS